MLFLLIQTPLKYLQFKVSKNLFLFEIIFIRIIYLAGCCKSEFDPTYPAHLNGIIRPDEFQYSMQMINQTISSRTSRILVGLIAALMVIGGIALFIAGGSSNGSSHSGGFPPLVGGGLALLFGGIIFLIFGQLVVENHRNKRMRQAIARESAKYSMRSPTPCSWRLHSTRTWSGGYRNRRSAIFYRVCKI
jgi:hypothetical protein